MNLISESTVTFSVERTENCPTSLDEAAGIWETISESLESFVEAWERGGSPPWPADFAPRDPPQARRLALVEMVKVDLEYRWQQGLPLLRLEEYGERLPELCEPDGFPADLIYEEFSIRRRAGESVDLQEYLQRFPQQTKPLRQILGLGHPEITMSLAAAMRPAGLKPGDQVDDFDLLAEVGRGAFASVFLARQRSLQRIVALKVSSNQGNEPQTLAQLDHPHIGRVYDQRLLPDRNLRLLYMKYVPGGTLAEAMQWSRQVPPRERSGSAILAAVDAALERRGEEPPLESAERRNLASCDWPMTVCRIGANLADALHYAHSRGVLHRDLKPANILLTAEGSPQLVDFNISFCSKLHGATPAAYFGGSLAYMSPEQLEACNPDHERTPDSLDGRSDIYALGVVLWEMLAGHRPFQDEQFQGSWTGTLAEMVERRLKGPRLEDLEQLPWETTAPIRDILRKCLAADAGRRPASAADLANELRLCLQPGARRLLRPPPGSLIHPARRWALIAILALAVLPNALAGWFNYVYNWDHIVSRLDDAQSAFGTIQAIINGVAFPAGMLLLAIVCLPVVRAVKGQGGLAGADGPRRRARCLRLGELAALIGITEWLLAGIAYPLGISAAGVQLNLWDCLHFATSLAMCGIIAAAYPFCSITSYAVHNLYPSLLLTDDDWRGETAQLRGIERKLWFYLSLGFLLPMLAVALLLTLGSDQYRTALATLSIGSLVGCTFLFWTARRIQLDVETLREAINNL